MGKKFKSDTIEFADFVAGNLGGIQSELANVVDGPGRIDETLHEFLTLLHAHLGADIISAFLLPPGAWSLGDAKLHSIVGASLKRRQARGLPENLVDLLELEPDRLHWFGEDSDGDISMASIFPVLQKRLKFGAAIALNTGGRLLGCLILGYSQSVHYAQPWQDMIASSCTKLARSIDHKRAYELLANTRLITAVQSAGEAIEITDAEGHIEYVNPAFEELSGFSAADALGRHLTTFLRHEPEDRVSLERMIQTLRNGQVWSGRLVARKRDGTFWYQGATISPVMGPDGAITHFVGVKRDISERIEAQIALRQSEESLAATLNSIGDALIVTDEAGCIVRMNPLAEEFTGWSQHHAQGQPLDKVLTVLSSITQEVITPSLVDDAMDESVTSIQNRDTILLSKAGTKRPVIASSAPVQMVPGRVSGVVLVFHDMTAEHAVAAELEQSQRDFRALIELNPDGISITRDGVWLYLNPAMVASLGYGSVEELIGRRLEEFLHSDEQTPLRTSPADVAEANTGDKDSALRIVRFLRQDGGTALLEMAPERVIRFEGELAVVHVSRDITDRKQMESQLMLADRMVSVGTLAAGVAHEINNPLAYVIANLSFVKDELKRLESQFPPGVIDEVKEALKETDEGAQRVRQIVKDLKTFTRGDEERRELVDVREVLESSINLAWNEIRHRAQLVRQFSDVPLIDGNKARLGQLFLNILINAAHAVKEGHIDRDLIHVSTGLSDEGNIVVSIYDTGPGIPPEIRERIFDPFFTTKPVGLGTGLGLSICHGIAVSMGAKIEIESIVGQGTTFHLSFPAPSRKRVEELGGQFVDPPLAPKLSQQRTGRILIVDDDRAVAKSLMRALAAHDVVAVHHGNDVARLWKEEPFDLIICDMMMPDLMGSDIYAMLKAQGDKAEEKLVFLTGGAFTKDAADFLESVPNARLDKPFDVEDILAVVRQFI